jgi:hypothetical protein
VDSCLGLRDNARTVSHAHATLRRTLVDDPSRELAAAVAAPPPQLHTGGLSAATVLELQRTGGNQAVGRLLQRHPAGAALTDKDEQVAHIQQAQTQGPSAAALAEPAAAAAPEEAEPALPEAKRSMLESAWEKTAAVAVGGGWGLLAEARRVLPGLSTQAMGLSTAQTILQGRFGDFKKIVPGTIVILADQAAIWAKYDEVCIADNLTNPDTGAKWKQGDAEAGDKAANVETDGFAWKGVVYVRSERSPVDTTAHEMLHLNAAADFRGTVGEAFNEGATEHLAREACASAAIRIPKAEENSYATEVAMTRKLAALIGEDVLIDAYFNGGPKLVTAYEAKKGNGTFGTLKGYADAKDTANADPLMTP